MADLVAWLRKQLDEDARVAQAAARRQPGGGSWSLAGSEIRAGDGAPVARHTWPHEGAHIATHDPARVLREIDAKRLTLERFADLSGENWQPGPLRAVRLQELRDAVRCLASPYADRPGYRENWAP